MAQAKAAAGTGTWWYTAQRALEAGVLEELQIHLIPVLLGGGRLDRKLVGQVHLIAGEALAACRAGDELVVTKLDRLARSLPDARDITDDKREDGRMRLGLQLNSFDWDGGPRRFAKNLARIAGTAEGAGFESIAVADHVWQHPIMGGPETNEPECYAMLSFLAAHTERVGLTAMVSGVHFRHAAMLVKAVTTLDVLSGGRAWLGVGSGHYEEETRGLGIPFPPQRERFEMLEETVRIALRMWSGDQGDERPFEGKHYRLGRPLNLPQSLSRPHPPIMIAGDGEKKTLKLVARYADAASLRPSPEIPRKLEVLRSHCEEEGRDYDSIEKTCAFSFDVGEGGEKADELIGQLCWLSGMGIETVIGMVPGVDRIRPLEIIGREVIPAVADV